MDTEQPPAQKRPDFFEPEISRDNLGTFVDIEVAQAKGMRFYVLIEDTGYINFVGRNLRLKSRIASKEPISEVKRFHQTLLLVRPSSLAFSNANEYSLQSSFCEGTFTGKYKFVQAVPERYRMNVGAKGQNMIFALTSEKELAIFLNTL